MSYLNACDFVAMTNAQLVKLGVPPELATYERTRRSGHVRRIAPRWARTIGWWGGVRSLREIAEHTEASVEQAHAWAMYWGLRTRTKHRVRTQAQLSVQALATPGPAAHVARAMGVLPVECVLYRAAAEIMRVELATPLSTLLTWSPEALEDAWHWLDLAIEHQTESPFDFSSPERPRDAAHTATMGTCRFDIDAVLRLVERELPDDDSEVA